MYKWYKWNDFKASWKWIENFALFSVLYLWYENLENDELWDSSYKCTFKSERVSLFRETQDVRTGIDN